MAGEGTSDQPFFIYDHTVLQKEEDDLVDAIIYYYPSKTSLDDRCALCGQLMGMVTFFVSFTGAPPSVISLEGMKLAVRHQGRYTLALGANTSLSDRLLTRQLDSLLAIFAFYHRSIGDVAKLCEKEPRDFKEYMEIIWNTYVPFVRYYGDNFLSAMQVVPRIHLTRGQSSIFLRACHLLQTCQRAPGVLAGCLLARDSILCTQLTPEFTYRMLLLRPQQSHMPCRAIKTDFTLPMGVRLLCVYLSVDEVANLRPSKCRWPQEHFDVRKEATRHDANYQEVTSDAVSDDTELETSSDIMGEDEGLSLVPVSQILDDKHEAELSHVKSTEPSGDVLSLESKKTHVISTDDGMPVVPVPSTIDKEQNVASTEIPVEETYGGIMKSNLEKEVSLVPSHGLSNRVQITASSNPANIVLYSDDRTPNVNGPTLSVAEEGVNLGLDQKVSDKKQFCVSTDTTKAEPGSEIVTPGSKESQVCVSSITDREFLDGEQKSTPTDFRGTDACSDIVDPESKESEIGVVEEGVSLGKDQEFLDKKQNIAGSDIRDAGACSDIVDPDSKEIEISEVKEGVSSGQEQQVLDRHQTSAAIDFWDADSCSDIVDPDSNETEMCVVEEGVSSVQDQEFLDRKNSAASYYRDAGTHSDIVYHDPKETKISLAEERVSPVSQVLHRKEHSAANDVIEKAACIHFKELQPGEAPLQSEEKGISSIQFLEPINCEQNTLPSITPAHDHGAKSQPELHSYTESLVESIVTQALASLKESLCQVKTVYSNVNNKSNCNEKDSANIEDINTLHVTTASAQAAFVQQTKSEDCGTSCQTHVMDNTAEDDKIQITNISQSKHSSGSSQLWKCSVESQEEAGAEEGLKVYATFLSRGVVREALTAIKSVSKELSPVQTTRNLLDDQYPISHTGVKPVTTEKQCDTKEQREHTQITKSIDQTDCSVHSQDTIPHRATCTVIELIGNYAHDISECIMTEAMAAAKKEGTTFEADKEIPAAIFEDTEEILIKKSDRVSDTEERSSVVKNLLLIEKSIQDKSDSPQLESGSIPSTTSPSTNISHLKTVDHSTLHAHHETSHTVKSVLQSLSQHSLLSENVDLSIQSPEDDMAGESSIGGPEVYSSVGLSAELEQTDLSQEHSGSAIDKSTIEDLESGSTNVKMYEQFGNSEAGISKNGENYLAEVQTSVEDQLDTGDSWASKTTSGESVDVAVSSLPSKKPTTLSLKIGGSGRLGESPSKTPPPSNTIPWTPLRRASETELFKAVKKVSRSAVQTIEALLSSKDILSTPSGFDGANMRRSLTAETVNSGQKFGEGATEDGAGSAPVVGAAQPKWPSPESPMQRLAELTRNSSEAAASRDMGKDKLRRPSANRSKSDNSKGHSATVKSSSKARNIQKKSTKEGPRRTRSLGKRAEDGLEALDLYIQGNADLLLLMLLESGASEDKETVQMLWQLALPELGEIDVQLKQGSRKGNRASAKRTPADYTFLMFDASQKDITGNTTSSVTAEENKFQSICVEMHDDFCSSASLTDITMRSRQSFVHGHRACNKETFFQQHWSARTSTGFPDKRETAMATDSVCYQKLLTEEHSLIV